MPDREEESQTVNLLDLVPVRAVAWEKDDGGRVSLLKPKFRHPWLVKHLAARMKRPDYRIRLDAVGSFLWEACDGHRRVGEMGAMLKDRFGDSVEPLYDRLALFLQSLERHGFVGYRD